MTRENYYRNKKQQKILGVILGIVAVGIVAAVLWPEPKATHPMPPGFTEKAFHHQDARFKPEFVRLSRLEQLNENIETSIKTLEETLEKTQAENQLYEKKNRELQQKQALHDM